MRERCLNMKIKKLLWGIFFVFFLIILIFSGYKIISIFFDNGGNVDKYIEETSTITKESESDSMADNHGIKWSSLKKANDDIYAWIYIPNTNVDYPIVQSSVYESDTLYLDHNIDKKPDIAGAIFSERANRKDFSDPVTVIYGHNMKNGSMFKTLHSFEDAKFFKKNKFIYIYTEKRKLTYEMYSAYVYDDRHILNSFNFEDKKIFKKYLKSTQNPQSLTKNTRKVDLSTDSKVLTLSTCTNGAANTRYLVQGVLIKDEQTK